MKNEALIKHMVDRFLGWKLPKDFYPDSFISFDREKYDTWGGYPNSWPTGTNLLAADQVRQMLEYLLDGYDPAAEEKVKDTPLTVEQLGLEEILQLGYTVKDGQLYPPTSGIPVPQADDKAGGEAVAWRFRFPTSDLWHLTAFRPNKNSRPEIIWEPLYTHPQPQAEARVPDGWEAMRHSANEWADVATNGLQWLRNIRDGISRVEDAIENMELGVKHCERVSASAMLAAAPKPETRP